MSFIHYTVVDGFTFGGSCGKNKVLFIEKGWREKERFRYCMCFVPEKCHSLKGA